MKKLHLLNGILFVIFIFIFSGCSSQQKEILDLDKILNVMQMTLDVLNSTTPVKSDMNPEVAEAESFLPIPPEQQNDNYNQIFIQKFETNLNNAGISKNRIGAEMSEDGSVKGYIDSNKNGTQDINEKTAFKIEIDPERNRLIATDTQNNYRRSSGYSLAQGLFAGYMLRSMFGRQRGMGITSSRFSNMKMSKSNYRKSAMSGFKKSAKSSGGSKSFKGGK